MERTNHLSWDEFFMAIAQISALRSKDPNTKVGACLVDNKNKVISTGYNGMPTGCKDSIMPWKSKSKNFLKSKYSFVCHAELNAVLNANLNYISNCILYTTLFPCNECAKIIIQSGIKKVIYKEDKYSFKDSVKAAKYMFDLVNVKYIKYTNSNKKLEIKI